MATHLTSPAALRDALARVRAVRPDRAAVVVGRVAPSRWDEVVAVLQEGSDASGERIVQRVDGADDGRDALITLNAQRDLLLPGASVVALLATSPEGAQAVRRYANDLTIAPSLTLDIREVLEVGDWAEVREQLRKLARDRYSRLDLTGLVPGTAEQTHLPLFDLYMDLVTVPRTPDGRVPAPHRWLVLGNPGAGKSTFLRFLAATYADGSADPLGVGGGCPVLVPLAEYGAARQEEIRPLPEFVATWLAGQGGLGLGALAGHWDEVILLLDGLDELRDPQGRREVLDAVRRWPEGAAPRAVVLTGRLNVVDDLRQADAGALQTVTCRAPDVEDIERFVERFAALRARPGTPPTDHAPQLIRRLANDGNLLQLAQNPLLLVFLVLLEELEGRLPERRIEVYYRMGELLVDRWTRARSMASTASQRRATRADALRVLGPLATWVVSQGGASLPQARFLEGLTAIEARRGGAENAQQRAKVLLDLLERDTALLARDSDNRWTFAHPSIAEYFAAVDAVRDPERWAALLADPFGAERRELVTFAAGYLGVISAEDVRLHELVQRVLACSKRAGRYGAAYPLLLMALIREQPGLAPQDEAALVRRLGALLFDVSYGQEAAWSVQREAVRFLEQGAQAPYRDALRTMLADRIARPIRWERLVGGFGAQEPLLLNISTQARPLAYHLLNIMRLFQLDTEAVGGQLRASEEPLLRVIGWLDQLAPEAQTPEGRAAFEALASRDPRVGEMVRAELYFEEAMEALWGTLLPGLKLPATTTMLGTSDPLAED